MAICVCVCLCVNHRDLNPHYRPNSIKWLDPSILRWITIILLLAWWDPGSSAGGSGVQLTFHTIQLPSWQNTEFEDLHQSAGTATAQTKLVKSYSHISRMFTVR